MNNKFTITLVLLFTVHNVVMADDNTASFVVNPTEKAREYLISSQGRYSLTSADIDEAIVQNSYTSKHNNVSHVYFKQTVDGIELHNGLFQINMDANNNVISAHDQFVTDLANKINTTEPTINAEQAIGLAINSIGIQNTLQVKLLSAEKNRTQSALYSIASASMKPVPAKLVFALDQLQQPRLAWDLEIQRSDAWWNIRVDAVSGDILAKDNWTAQESYGVFPIPYESPGAMGASHQVVVNVADAIASPFGWHDTDGIAGAEFTDTRGNNVSAQDDIDGNNSGGLRPDGGALLEFEFAFDPNLEPAEGENLEVGIVNLFYWNNIIHDVMYQYGFDEVSGNFQVNNYGNGGSGNDSVNADAQDGSGLNNANFSTPPDGSSPRMQMFLFSAGASMAVNTPASIAGDYSVASSSFGATLNAVGITGILEEVNDGIDVGSDSCTALTAFTAGRIAVIDRGSCEFGLKVLNAEQAGAIAALVINNAGDGVINMGPGAVGDTVTIPSVFIGQTDGNLIRAELANNVDITMSQESQFIDGDLDNGIIVHEYGHGISNRLTGGPAAAGCLQNAEQMGEGWSDYFALVMTAQSGDQGLDSRPMGTYAGSNPAGIRQFPYTTDMSVNLHTFADISSVSIPHGVGSVWAQMLWEVYWNLVDKHGYDADLYNGTGGNNIALQLVIDGLKLQPCIPSFVQGRDAILAADMTNNAGANQCEIWNGFAKRGLGFSAVSGDSDTLGDETEAFDLPGSCTLPDVIFVDGFE
ncbi:MAG: M36 family metallopeptidase [Proteobacteria bacterium]|nr:M36 family metallopeptidase [Pseudomonadota bacterium]